MKNNLISVNPTLENLALSLVAMICVLLIERWWADAIDRPRRRALRLRQAARRRRRRRRTATRR